MKSNHITIIIIAALVLLAAVLLFGGERVTAPREGEQPADTTSGNNKGEEDEPASMRTVQLYYYNPDKDTNASGTILCSEKGLVAVSREIPVTVTPIQDTINLLLKGDLSAAEQAEGIETEYPLSELRLTGANLEDGTLTLSFDDPRNLTSGGSCRVTILREQIRATAQQFEEVDEVRFMPEEVFQP